MSTSALWLCGGVGSRRDGGVTEEPRPCPRCAASVTIARARRAARGYRIFRCRACRRWFNERTGTPCNYPQYPTDLALLVVPWRPRYTPRLRDLAEMFRERGFVFSHGAARDWEARRVPLLAERSRAKRRGRAGAKGHAAETDVRVGGRWCYRYRATDREGHPGDALPSEQRDMDAARRFFARAPGIVGHAPAQVTTDGHAAYPRAIRETPGDEASHRTSRDKSTRIEQDHRGIEQRQYPRRGFGAFASAARFCPAFAEQRQYFRTGSRSGERVSTAERRVAITAELAAA